MPLEARNAAELAERCRSRLAPLEPLAPLERGLRASAVLVPLLDLEKGPGLLFIRRSHGLPDHAGQVAFPGGRWEPGDANLYATALRESVEEVGAKAAAVCGLGALDPVSTLGKYAIQPFLSLWPAGDYHPVDRREVARVFQVPLAWLAAPDSQCEVEVCVAGQSLHVPAWEWDGEVIWGATRRITLDLIRRLREEA